jgi:hypothetical protein
VPGLMASEHQPSATATAPGAPAGSAPDGSGATASSAAAALPVLSYSGRRNLITRGMLVSGSCAALHESVEASAGAR